MTSRYYKVTLGKNNINVYEENINFLYLLIIHIFNNLKIGNGAFTPVQRGIMISTQSIIDLTEYLITNRNFQYVFTPRFTQDCVENLFSQIRQKNVIPYPLQFTNNLNLIAIAMYIKDINNISYGKDDRQYLSGFLKYLAKEKKEKSLRLIWIKIKKIWKFFPLIKI